MLELLFSRCDECARLMGAACLNALIPSVIAAVLTLYATKVKSWNAASRYAAWWLTLLFVVLLPVAMILFGRTPQQAEAGSTVTQNLTPPHATAYRSAKPAVVTRSLSSQRPFLPSGAALLWVLSCGLILTQFARVFVALLASLRLKRRAVAPQDQALSARFAKLVRIMRVRRTTSFLLSDGTKAPVAIGYWRPSILLPRALAHQLDASETEQVLAHELAHLNRYDDCLIALQRMVQALFAFHPLVQWIAHRMELEREMACDDQVMSAYQPRAHAACLTRIAELVAFGPAMTLTVPLLARKSHLAARVEGMLDRTRAHMPTLSSRRLVPFALLGSLAALVSLRAPALWALPDPQVQAESPSKHTPASSNSINSIAVASETGSSTTFAENSNTQMDHSPFPRGTIVFERNGNSYIIRDAPTLAAAQELLRPQQELSRQQEALGAQQEKLGKLQEDIGRKQESRANQHLNAAVTRDLENQPRDLEAKLRSMNVANSIKTVTDAQEQISALQEKLGEMQSRIGEEQGKVGEAQGKLGEQQCRLGDQQGLLGEQQGKLGEQQAREAKRAEQKLRELIQRAEAQGLVQPLR